MADKGIKMTRLKDSVIKSPAGTARYAYIDKPDDSAFGKGRFRITVVFKKGDPEVAAFKKKLQAYAVLHAAEIGKPAAGARIPFKLVDEKMSKGKNPDVKPGTGDEVGLPYVEFVTNGTVKGEAITIPTFNAAGKPDMLSIYGGDTVRVEGRVMGWELAGDHGVKVYLNAVQQLESGWSGGTTGGSFNAEAEYLTEEADDATDEAGQSFADADETDDSDFDTPDDDGDDTDPLVDLI